MPDTAGSDKRVQTSLRGIARTARFNAQHRFRDLFGLLDVDQFQFGVFGSVVEADIKSYFDTMPEAGADVHVSGI